MKTSFDIPKFCKNQQVFFIGGSGIIKNYFLSSGRWVYLVEMELGPVPDMGRIGFETTILLSQTDLEPALG
ncbi:hypothetical protein PCC9214_03448 [Planktothrix tepida]|uniref:Uncharacterized protein n=2 Tax=Planktothrix TaxID=54304 RepID=A0A1J1LR00_9CYAN|nr:MULTISPECIES: hypothetical protein [Planktothrix]CAD5945535.1 hypothetical protein NO713_02207 [Planktothrix pseudagardhii]CAD5965227.1 hypothetical protein PCC9214_03448 [Planktothrix tepida]CUR34995.1 conserved hypothetical protein [Planktothrix tepida PCC 9214]